MGRTGIKGKTLAEQARKEREVVEAMTMMERERDPKATPLMKGEQ